LGYLFPSLQNDLRPGSVHAKRGSATTRPGAST